LTLTIPPLLLQLSLTQSQGDTPMDVQAALASGAAALGVATGVFPLESLRALGAPPRVVVLESLEDTEAVMAALGLS
jgi:phosphoglycolate phosphatase-like HAD superfamily hydrolase